MTNLSGCYARRLREAMKGGGGRGPAQHRVHLTLGPSHTVISEYLSHCITCVVTCLLLCGLRRPLAYQINELCHQLKTTSSRMHVPKHPSSLSNDDFNASGVRQHSTRFITYFMSLIVICTWLKYPHAFWLDCTELFLATPGVQQTKLKMTEAIAYFIPPARARPPLSANLK